MAATNLGNVAVVPRGAWSDAVAYKKNSLVGNAGNMYLATKDAPAGTPTTDVEYWMLSAAKGADGDVTTSAMNTAISSAITTANAPIQNQVNTLNTTTNSLTTRMTAAETSIIPVKRGGGGANNAAGIRSNLGITPTNIGAAPTSHQHSPNDISSAVPISKGGHGGTTAAQGVANMGYATHMVIFSATEPAVVNGKIWLKPI